MGLKARRIILQVCRLETRSICTKVPLFNCFAHCLPYKPNFAKSLDPAYITCQANFASRVGRFKKQINFHKIPLPRRFCWLFNFELAFRKISLPRMFRYSVVFRCADVFKHGQFPQNLRADTFPFISYIARQQCLYRALLTCLAMCALQLACRHRAISTKFLYRDFCAHCFISIYPSIQLLGHSLFHKLFCFRSYV